MSQSLAVGDPVARPAAAHEGSAALDPRRKLQLALASIWLLDALLQFQPVMFGHGFGQMLAGSAAGNPAIVARPVSWSAAFIDQHVAVLNAVLAAIQLLLGLGIAWRPTLRLALAASAAWALAVWWLGEGLGGLLSGTASPVNGAPGAVLLYALLAVLLWPAAGDPAVSHLAARDPAARDPAARDRAVSHPAAGDPAAPFPAARAVGRRAARACWLVLWLGLAGLTVLPATRAPRALGDLIAATTPGEPAWLVWIDTHAASVLTRHGLLASVLLAAVLAVVALTLCLPARPAARAAVILALVVAAVLWLAQGLGGLLTGAATDPGTAPLLALLALAFWPAAPLAADSPADPAAPPAGETGGSPRSIEVNAQFHPVPPSAAAPGTA
jgi:hypothetical protein